MTRCRHCLERRPIEADGMCRRCTRARWSNERRYRELHITWPMLVAVCALAVPLIPIGAAIDWWRRRHAC